MRRVLEVGRGMGKEHCVFIGLSTLMTNVCLSF